MIKATARILQMSNRGEFDATPYFEQASEAEIDEALAFSGKRSWENMKIVRFLAKCDPEGAVADLFDYAVGHDAEMVVDVDRDDVLRWVDERAARELETGREPTLQQAFDEAASRIAVEAEKLFLRRSHFHLAACGGCGAPSFAQPCALCSHYEMGESWGGTPKRDPVDREAFKRAVENSVKGGQGNLATWYFASFRRSVAYKRNDAYAATVERLVEKGARMGGWPDPAAVHDHVAAGGTVRRRPLSPERRQIWDAVEGLQGALELARRDTEHAGHNRGLEAMSDAVREAGKAAVAFMYAAGTKEEAVTAMSNAVDAFLAGGPGRPSWVPVGNVRNVRDQVEAMEEELRATAAPTF